MATKVYNLRKEYRYWKFEPEPLNIDELRNEHWTLKLVKEFNTLQQAEDYILNSHVNNPYFKNLSILMKDDEEKRKFLIEFALTNDLYYEYRTDFIGNPEKIYSLLKTKINAKFKKF